jgi:hypothetical protein
LPRFARHDLLNVAPQGVEGQSRALRQSGKILRGRPEHLQPGLLQAPA